MHARAPGRYVTMGATDVLAARLAIGGLAAELRAFDGLWLISWEDGPTLARMREPATALIAGHAAAAGARVAFSRSTTPRAWAARATAAVREGRLAQVLPRGATAPEGLVDVTPAHLALIAYVQVLVDTTDDPGRPDLPEDAPWIERLLDATGGDRTLMAVQVLARLNTAASPAPADPCSIGTCSAGTYDELAARRLLRSARGTRCESIRSPRRNG
ncbi:hypothetical protein [Actinomadura sp. 9N407]|uniref:hypothetical protein n=1 Tax=Actinomadura sp. 9N407 TaxID=3375154 RepID=UPI0037BB02D6